MKTTELRPSVDPPDIDQKPYFLVQLAEHIILDMHPQQNPTQDAHPMQMCEQILALFVLTPPIRQRPIFRITPLPFGL